MRRVLPIVLLAWFALGGCDRGAAPPSPPPPGADPSPAAASRDLPGVGRSDHQRPDVLLLIADTLRADRLPVYGFEWGKTPTLSRLSKEAMVFDHAVAASASTVPSHASLFTSRFVRQHSVGYSNGGTRLGDEATIAEHFRDAGYATAGFISNIMLNQFTGMSRGFDLYDDRLPTQELNRPQYFERTAPQTTQKAIRWLTTVGEKPVFLLVHYQDPHGPYTPPDRVLSSISLPERPSEPRLPVNRTQNGFGGIPAYQALPGIDRPSEYERRYVAEILYMDRWMGLLLDAFEKHRPEAGHVVLFTSDHGESLGEEGHWFEHGHTSMPELAHIPFLLRAPGISPGRTRVAVSHVDVMPTLLELAGLPVPDDASGIALGPYLREGRDLPSRELYCDMGPESGVYDDEGFTRIEFPSPEAAAKGDVSEAVVERYRWTGEGTWTKAEQGPPLGEETRSYLSNVTPPRDVDAATSDDQVERLRALGYIEPAEGH